MNHAITAFWLNMWLWPLPEFDYWAYALQQQLRSDVIPNIPGW